MAVFFARRGHRVFRPDASRTAHLRRALAGRRKTNRTCAEVLALYGDPGAVAFEVLAEELAAELSRLEVAEATLRPLERRREESYRKVDPTRLARSLPGIARVGAPLGVVFTGRPGRFPSGDRYASYVGLVPGSSETGETDRNSAEGSGPLLRDARPDDPPVEAGNPRLLPRPSNRYLQRGGDGQGQVHRAGSVRLPELREVPTGFWWRAYDGLAQASAESRSFALSEGTPP